MGYIKLESSNETTHELLILGKRSNSWHSWLRARLKPFCLWLRRLNNIDEYESPLQQHVCSLFLLGDKIMPNIPKYTHMDTYGHLTPPKIRTTSANHDCVIQWSAWKPPLPGCPKKLGLHVALRVRFQRIFTPPGWISGRVAQDGPNGWARCPHGWAAF